MNKEKFYNLCELLQTTQDQNILWVFLLKNNDDYNNCIAQNSNCPAEILTCIYNATKSKKNIAYYTKYAIASNPNCSINLCNKLFVDSSNSLEDRLVEQVVYYNFKKLSINIIIDFLLRTTNKLIKTTVLTTFLSNNDNRLSDVLPLLLENCDSNDSIIIDKLIKLNGKRKTL